MKSVVTCIVLMVATIFLAGQAGADIYKWVDQDGVLHFSDTRPGSGQQTKTIKTSNYSSPTPSRTTIPETPHIASGSTAKKELPKKITQESQKKKNRTNKVVIYTTSWCGYCKKAVAFLRSNNIKFTQYDIEKNPKANAEMLKLRGPGGVPFAIINGKKVRGFSEKTYRRVLGL